MEVEINDIASRGAVKDVEGYMLPPEAWTTAFNVRFFDEAAERLGGRTQVFGTPTVAPHFALPVSTSAQTYWIYASLTKAYVFDGSTHTNITRQSAGVDVDYTASLSREWNGLIFGGVPILNNGVDVPQFWSAINPATKLANLTNWPSTHRAKILRSLGPYLLACGTTVSGSERPHQVLWSHPAVPGAIPSSWDVADATKDAGEYDLSDTRAGVIRDALSLGDHLYIYKEGSVWRARIIGGSAILAFDRFVEETGILAPRCVTVTGDGKRQVFASQDDILIHNGQSVTSILTERYKTYLFNQIDTDNYLNSFMFTNPIKNEIWFCFPESGQTNPTRALIWNYKSGEAGAISETDVNFRNVALGNIETATETTWATVTGTWGEQLGPWSQLSRRKVVLCATDVTKFLELDSGSTNNGAAILATLQRLGLAVEGRKRNGEWIVNFHSRKLVTRLWLKTTAVATVRLGRQETVTGAITWTAAVAFDPLTQNYIDFEEPVNGAAISIELTASIPFRLLGYKLEGDIVGEL